MPKFVVKYENGYVTQEKLFPNGKEIFFNLNLFMENEKYL